MNKIFLIICILNLYLGEYEGMNKNINIKNETINSFASKDSKNNNNFLMPIKIVTYVTYFLIVIITMCLCGKNYLQCSKMGRIFCNLYCCSCCMKDTKKKK